MDGNERRWLNEGLSQLAEHLNGFDPQAIGIANVSRFLAAPDHYLSGWLFDNRDVACDYGAAYLFLVYLYEQFGLDFINTVAISEHDGLASIQAALAELDGAPDVDAVFADWMLANLLDDPYVGDGRYYYRTLDLPEAIALQPLAVPPEGALYRDQINQYGADYLLLDGPATYQISFDGADETTVLGVQPPSGEWMWWSNDLNSSAVSLTAAFDLSGPSTATLAFSAWWNIEPKGDWLQVLVSEDGGRTWQSVGGPSASRHRQVAGPSYSGQSGAWAEERIDLSDFAGRQVLVRFEYVTDGGRTLSGVALDDLGIVEPGKLDDVENPSSAGGGRLPTHPRPRRAGLVAGRRGADARPANYRRDGAAGRAEHRARHRNGAGRRDGDPRGGGNGSLHGYPRQLQGQYRARILAPLCRPLGSGHGCKLRLKLRPALRGGLTPGLQSALVASAQPVAHGVAGLGRKEQRHRRANRAPAQHAAHKCQRSPHVGLLLAVEVVSGQWLIFSDET